MGWTLVEITDCARLDQASFKAEVVARNQPVILRGVVKDWDSVKHASESDEALVRYLDGFYNEEPVLAWLAPRTENGRFFYNEAMTGFNFSRRHAHLTKSLDVLLKQVGEPNAPDIYIGATSMNAFLPGFTQAQSLPFLDANIDPNIWAGTASLVAPHIDMSDNIAVAICGHRRFTLFPPEEVANLYLGPLDFTPAGQPLSLVDVRNPDFARFPRYKKALENSQTAELNPGDGIYIPATWWHGVESLDDFNVLVNYWWSINAPEYGSPFETLVHGLMTIAQLPPARRQAWHSLFDALVFQLEGEAMAHLPEEKRGPHKTLSPELAKSIKGFLRKSLN